MLCLCAGGGGGRAGSFPLAAAQNITEAELGDWHAGSTHSPSRSWQGPGTPSMPFSLALPAQLFLGAWHMAKSGRMEPTKNLALAQFPLGVV